MRGSPGVERAQRVLATSRDAGARGGWKEAPWSTIGFRWAWRARSFQVEILEDVWHGALSARHLANTPEGPRHNQAVAPGLFSDQEAPPSSGPPAGKREAVGSSFALVARLKHHPLPSSTRLFGVL